MTPYRAAVGLVAGKRQSLTVPLIAVALGDASVTVCAAFPAGWPGSGRAARPAHPPGVHSRHHPHGGGSEARRHAGAADRELLAASSPGRRFRQRRHLAGRRLRRAVACDVARPLAAAPRPPAAPCRCSSTSTTWLPASAWPATPNLRQRIQEAVYKVFTNQSSSGSFGPVNGPGDLWLDAYVTDFLTRARARNTTRRSRPSRRPRPICRTRWATTRTCRTGRAARSPMCSKCAGPHQEGIRGRPARYYADKLESFASSMAVAAQLGAALSLYGDAPAREVTFDAALPPGCARRLTTITTAPIIACAARRRRHAGALAAAESRFGAEDRPPRKMAREGQLIRAGPARRTMPGCCWPPARWKDGNGEIALTVDFGALLGRLFGRGLRQRPADSPDRRQCRQGGGAAGRRSAMPRPPSCCR